MNFLSVANLEQSKNDLYRVCSLWVLCGRSWNMIILFSLAFSSTTMCFGWVEWPSKTKSTLFPLVGFTLSIKCFSHYLKIWLFIASDSEMSTMTPGGAPAFTADPSLALPSMIIRATYCPDAVTKKTLMCFFLPHP